MTFWGRTYRQGMRHVRMKDPLKFVHIKGMKLGNKLFFHLLILLVKFFARSKDVINGVALKVGNVRSTVAAIVVRLMDVTNWALKTDNVLGMVEAIVVRLMNVIK